MKKIILLSIILAIKWDFSIAQNNIIKVNLFSPIVRTGSFFFERMIKENSSLQIGFFYTGYTLDDTQLRGFGITPEFRYYPSGNAMDGFYVAPFLRYQSLTLSEPYFDPITLQKEREDEGTLSTLGGGLLIGRQWIFGDRISLDLFIGPCINIGDVETNTVQTSFSTEELVGFGVRTGVTVGLVF